MWEKGNTVETVVLLSHKSPDSVINAKVEFGEDDDKVPLNAYKMMREYVEQKYGFKVHIAYIAAVKRSL